jgi:2-polyprenyl-3-methyl-5-hydroxy-6-metoxy-1,4-benzoquinol methylase
MKLDRRQVFGQLDENTYERIAPGYFPEAVVQEHLARYRWAARWLRSGRVLDVGCGLGYGRTVFSANGMQMVGLDLSMSALRAGLEKYGGAFVCGNAQELPFSSEAFDGATCFEAIEHVPDAPLLLREIHRVLRKEGLLVLSTPNRLRTAGTNPYHLREFTLEELTSAVESAGLTVARITGQHWRINSDVLFRIRGVRRLLYAVDNLSTVCTIPARLATPAVFVLLARKSNLEPRGEN